MRKFSFLLLLLGLLVATSVGAETKVVTNTEKSKEGSFDTIIKGLQDGDTILFDKSLSGQVASTMSCNKKGLNYTIIGNGIISSNNVVIAGGIVTLKDISFQDKTLNILGSVEEVHIINCAFNAGNAASFKLISPTKDTKAYFEGCSFISQKGSKHILEFNPSSSKQQIDYYFTSCSFYNEQKVTDGYIFFNQKPEVPVALYMLNSVIIDNNESISNFPIISKGYNVIKGNTNNIFTAEKTDICGMDIEDPIILHEDVLKVRKKGMAYEHYPAQEDAETYFFEGMHFPEKDIQDVTIDYSKKTHSGASQTATDIEIPVKSISFDKSKITIILPKKATETLTVKRDPLNATFDPSLLKWESSDEKIATVDDNGIVTAHAAGEAILTAIYNGDEKIKATCTLTVYPYETVTTAAGSGAGSLTEVLNAVQNGDTITFAKDLAEAISISELLSIEKSLVILGNGAKIAGGTESLKSLRLRSTGKMLVENLHFKNICLHAEFNEGDVTVRNCSFENGGNDFGITASLRAPHYKALYVEGCQFVIDQTAFAVYAENLGKEKIYLTSCNLINNSEARIADPNMSEGNLIYISTIKLTNPDLSAELVLTNNVIQDNFSASSGDKKQIPFAIAAPIIRSNGYNVIKGFIRTSLIKDLAVKNELNAEKGDSINPMMLNPLVKDSESGWYKVVEGRNANNHFPAGKTFEGIDLPQKDLTGKEISYNEKTQSGAIQETITADGTLTDFRLIAGNDTLEVGQSSTLGLIYQPENAAAAEITWKSADESKITVTDGQVKALQGGTVAITANCGDKASSIELFVNTIPVEKVSLAFEKDTLTMGWRAPLKVSVYPANAANRAVTWESLDKEIIIIDEYGYVTPVKEGIGKIRVSAAENESIADTCELEVMALDYTNGVFLVNEDWFSHYNGTVNYLTTYGKWLNRVVQHENPGHELGATTQYGSIYGDKLYLVSKQEKDPGASTTGSRFAIVDAKTMKLEKEFQQISYGDKRGDGRSFLGVDEHTGYVATSNGIFVFNLDKQEFTGYIKGTEGGSDGSAEDPGNDAGLYTAQVGSMLRIGDRVFANHQEAGLLVIDPTRHTVDTILSAYHFTAITQAKDGNLWAGTTSSIEGSSGGNQGEKQLVKINPWTLEMTAFKLDVDGPYATWGAWHADAFCASETENKLYWKAMPTWVGKVIYEYDIDKNTVREFFNMDDYNKEYNTDGPEYPWSIYETGFRIDPRTQEMYISAFKGVGELGKYNRTLKMNLETGEIINYTMDDYFWFPAMFVFPDQEKPVIEGLDETITMKGRKATVDLRVSDKDNFDAGIIVQVSKIERPDLLKATIAGNRLSLSLVREVNANEEESSSQLTLKVNSNGKVVEKTITVKIEMVPVKNITIDKPSLSLPVGESVQLKATIAPANATYTKVYWSSSDKTIASVTENGLVKALKVGSAVIFAYSEDSAKVATCVVSTQGNLLLNKQSITLKTGEEYRLTTNALSGQELKWSSSDAEIVTVDNGLVITSKPGVAIVTAQNVTTGEEATCMVMVLSNGIEIKPEVETEKDAAYIIFPKVEDIDYYKLSLYQKVKNAWIFKYALNIGPDGSLLRSTRAAKEGNIGIYLANLEKSKEYSVKVEAMRTMSNGKKVVIADFSTNFTIGIPTANESISDQEQGAYYNKGILTVRGLSGYTCHIVALSGRNVTTFKVASMEETYRMTLPAGIYLLVGEQDSEQVSFKFQVQ